MKYRIIRIKNVGNVYSYLIKKGRNIHRVFCELLIDLGIDKDEVLREVDIIFDDLDNEFIYVRNNKFDIYFFITIDYINLVIKTNVSQEELNKVLRKYFSFPK